MRGRTVCAALTLLLLAGLWLRIRNIGELGLVADEGIQALAVKAVLENGVPKVGSGKIYARGIPFLYMETASAKWLGLNETALRLPAALFNVAAILLIYWLGAAVFDWRVGLLSAAIMAFSIWGIEMSHYARFYTAFQCAYMLSLLFFYQALKHPSWRAWAAFTAAALFAFTLHSLSIFIVTFFLIPVICRPYNSKPLLKWAGAAFGFALLWAGYGRLINAWEDASGPMLASKAIASRIQVLSAHIILPPLRPALARFRESPVAIWFVVVIVIAATIYLLVKRRSFGGWVPVLLAIAMVWAAAFYQFGLVLLLGIVYLTFAGRKRSVADRPLLVVYASTLASLGFWLPWMIKGSASRYALAEWFFGYPAFYDYFLSWYVHGWPIMITGAFLGAWILWRRFLADKNMPSAVILAALFVPAVLTSFLQNGFYASRYTFHLYPLIVLLFAFVVVELLKFLLSRITWPSQLSRSVAAAAGVLAALILSQDANPAAAWAIADKTYQSPRDPVRAPINSPVYGSFYQDHKTPALYVKQHAQINDRIIAFGLPHKVAIYATYIGRMDYSVEEQVKNYQLHLADGRVIEHVTGNEVIQDLAGLKKIIETTEGRVWILTERSLLADRARLYSEPIKTYLRRLADTPAYVGLDGQTLVLTQ